MAATTAASVLAAVGLALVGCKSKPDAGKGAGAPPAAVAAAGSGIGGGPGLSAVAEASGLALPVSDVAGPAITPVAGAGLTFVVPQGDVTWMEVSFPCYAAGATMSSGADGHPGAPIAGVSPAIPAVMAAAGIDLDHDLTAIGGFACGDKPCIYIAAHLAAPARIADGLAAIPGIDVTDHGGGHYSFAAPGANGPRSIHVRVVPVRWPAGRVADDPWNAAQLATTHVLFLSGLIGGDDVDPTTRLLAGKDAAAKVAATEQLVDGARGRCMLGRIGRQDDVKPGFVVDRGRFVVAAPVGKGDPLTTLMSSKRSLALEIELTMTPAPTDADLARWTRESRTWMAGVAAPIRQQFAAGGPAVDVVFDMIDVLVEHGFTATIHDRDLRLSWRTDRVPASALEALERRFQATMGTP